MNQEFFKQHSIGAPLSQDEFMLLELDALLGSFDDDYDDTVEMSRRNEVDKEIMGRIHEIRMSAEGAQNFVLMQQIGQMILNKACDHLHIGEYVKSVGLLRDDMQEQGVHGHNDHHHDKDTDEDDDDTDPKTGKNRRRFSLASYLFKK